MTTKTKMIDLGLEFTDFPGGRELSDGPYSGEAFRKSFILPNISEDTLLEIKIDNAKGFGSSFLEECFGGLVREGYSEAFLKDHLKISYENDAYSFYEEEIWQYIKDAEIERARK